MLAWRCEKYGVAPDAGGMLDQPLKTTRLMSIAEYTHRAFDKRLHAKSLMDFTERYPAYFAYTTWVDKLRDRAEAG